jgi:hypothetical protein
MLRNYGFEMGLGINAMRYGFKVAVFGRPVFIDRKGPWRISQQSCVGRSAHKSSPTLRFFGIIVYQTPVLSIYYSLPPLRLSLKDLYRAVSLRFTMKNIAISAFLGHAALAHAQWWAGAPDCAVRPPPSHHPIYRRSSNPFETARLFLLLVVLFHRLAGAHQLLLRQPGRLRVELPSGSLLGHAYRRDLL